MTDHYFISYSAVNGGTFALKLADELAAGPPPISVWFDKRNLRPGEEWDEQLVEAIKTCRGMIFIMSRDSVNPLSVCKNEWVRALRYKKPVIPLLLERDAEMPFRLGSRHYIDFTGSFETGLAQLRKHITWMDSLEGKLQALKYRLEDAWRELPRTNEAIQQDRIKEEISELERQVNQQEAIIANPQAAAERVRQSIERGLERVREPEKPVSGHVSSKFINPPPLIAPTWFQDRHVETGLIADFLRDDALRLMTIVGRGGIGKTAMVCRLLRALEGGWLPDDGSPLRVDGIVYLSNARSFHRATLPDLYAGLTKLTSEEVKKHLDSIYQNPQIQTREKVQALLAAFPQGRTVILPDNFEDTIDIESGRMKDAELGDALRALLELPPHGLKVIITTRVAPVDLALIEPGRQRPLNLDNGLEHPFAENILRTMDSDGKAGLRDAPESLLTEARERTRGYPRALEHLFGILSADRDTTLQEILEDTRRLLPEQVVTVLVGEAFSRLDPSAQRVMQGLAVFRYPAPPAAVNYLLQPYISGVDSGSVLGRLVNMQFVHREFGRYYLHQVDRDYALSRIPEGAPDDREADPLPFSRFALQNRAAGWFKESRRPRETWKTLEDLAPQIAEFELHCAGENYDTAAEVLLEIDFNYLQLWGHYRLVIEFHERLSGKINKPVLKQECFGNLGSAQLKMGRYQQAIASYKQALYLAQAHKDRWGESAWLDNLGLCYGRLGQISQAIDYLEQALNISCEISDREGEASDLINLGNQYAALSQIPRAIENYERALGINRKLGNRRSEIVVLIGLGNRYAEVARISNALKYYMDALVIAKEIGFRSAEAAIQVNIGHIYFDLDKWDDAIQQFKQAIEIGDDIGDFQIQNEVRQSLAQVNLYRGEIGTAREMARAACQYNGPLTNPDVWIIQGEAALLQDDRRAAQEAFIIALNQAKDLLTQNPQLYTALEIKVISLAGLALCKNSSDARAAEEAFKAARAVNSAPGIVRRCLRLFDILAKADSKGILAGVRKAAAGE